MRGFVMVTITTSVMMTMLGIISGRSLSIDCTTRSLVLRQTWRQPCRGSSQLSIAVSDKDTEAAVTPMPVKTSTRQLRLLKEDSDTAMHRAMKLMKRYVTKSSRIDGQTAVLLKEQFTKSPEFPYLRPLNPIEVSCSNHVTNHRQRKRVQEGKKRRDRHFQQTLNDVVIRSVEVLSFSSVLLERAIMQEDCNEPIPLSDSMVRLQHDVTTMLCRLQLIVYPRSIDSLPSKDTLQGLQRIGHTYQPLAEGSSPIPRHWIDYLVLRDIVNATRELKRLYANLIDHNCKTVLMSKRRRNNPSKKRLDLAPILDIYSDVLNKS